MTAAQLELTEPTIRKSGKKWIAICPACGELGKNTTEAYATETAAAHVAEKHPDWAVQSIDRPAPVLELRDLPVGQVWPSPTNPRGTNLGDIDGLAASIASVGIIEPLIVEPDDSLDDQPAWRLIAGERRWTAAKQAGLDVVPCVIRPNVDDDHRLELMLIENLQREGVNAMGEARAFRTLEQLGLSQRTIAARVGCSQSHISKRLTLLDLPAAVQKRVGGKADAGGITVAAALELTKLKDDPKAIAEIAKRKDVDADDVAHAVEQRRREVEAEAKYEAAVTDAKAHGWTVVKMVKPKGSYYEKLPDGVRQISASEWDRDLKVDLAKHKKEPCHAVRIAKSYGGVQTTHLCNKPARHGPKGDSDLKLIVTPKRKLSAHEIREKERQKNHRDAAVTRTAHLRAVFSPNGKTKVKQADVWELVARAAIDQLDSEEKKVLCSMLEVEYSYGIEAVWALAERDLVRVAGAAALARLERQAQFSYSSNGRLDLYRFLRARGYEPNAWELELIGDEEKEEEARAGIRDRLVAMVEAVANADERHVWAEVAMSVDEESIVAFFGDPDDDTPVDRIDDDTIARQAFAEFFADELATRSDAIDDDEPELLGASA